MSTALAIAGVTAVLRNLLHDGLIDQDASDAVGPVTVSVLPPDRVVPAQGSEPSQLNLFLHRVTPNLGWRNDGLPARDASGGARLGNPPLALDLHYLLSAYGGADFHAEILLGYAMQLFHENSVLPRGAIHAALNPAPTVGDALPAALQALADCGLEHQIEQIKVTPEYPSLDDLSKFWTAAQSHFRPTAAYLVTVVLIESAQPARAPLPVLSRGEFDPDTHRERGIIALPFLVPPYPHIDAVVPSGEQPAAVLGGTIELQGARLAGAQRTALLRNDAFEIDEEIEATGTQSETSLEFSIPTERADDFPVGAYRVGARLVLQGEIAPRETNHLALTIAPEIVSLPNVAVPRQGDGTAEFDVAFTPALREDQHVVLVLGQRELAPAGYVPPVTSLHFVVHDAQLGSHLVRLRIDGIESPIIDREAKPPKYLDLRIVIE